MPRFNNLLNDTMTSEEYLNMTKKSRWNNSRVKSKHIWTSKSHPFPLYEDKARAERSLPDGDTLLHFPSKAEAQRYQQLWTEEQDGEITDLQVHPPMDIVKINRYTLIWKADFSYVRDGVEIVEDVKSYRKNKSAWYVANGATKLRMKLFYEAIRPIDDTVKFYLVDGNGFRELYQDAKFI